ncbi:DUF1963 domain-containing protein [Agrobacterium tumefaciens]|nr:DUF1963 domain-containing protein [Agrobacterium tumefaciens]NTE94353.1 DUF1963 domain-containing protein [Agrobacterium tumefaciens]QAB00148.1 hypothetical protein DC439_20795 [Agrobacterium tumefaciens]UXS10804.1 DUF1963 domain-containing protein [Agrobacterium tumefaciens]UXS18167.1 DUF1963 domain-containing protein [Agrobacterium tumefaciens]
MSARVSGQFDLAELSTFEGFDPAFPDHGRLLVFYDYWEQPEDFTPAASVGWRVMWDYTPVSKLVRAPAQRSCRRSMATNGRASLTQRGPKRVPYGRRCRQATALGPRSRLTMTTPSQPIRSGCQTSGRRIWRAVTIISSAV